MRDDRAHDPPLSARARISPPEEAPRRPRLRYGHLAAAWALLLAPLTLWGLPSTRDDGLLFGGGPAWDASRFDAARRAAAHATRPAGADTDANPLGAVSRPTLLTTDDAARAEILLRYRLYSRQPDEMITFRALARMKPRQLDFDPRLYQYGGGYIYLVGAALYAAKALGLVALHGDLAAYLTRPEAFARFYVVARLISLLFAALALVAVGRLGQLAGGRICGWLALAFAAVSPVLLSGALEAKPHVPSACATLWATIAILRWMRRPRRRDALRSGLLGGYAVALVPTGLAAWLLWPAAWLAVGRARRTQWPILAGATALGALVYAGANPYVLYNLAFNRAALASNVGNTWAMYDVGRVGEGALRVGELLLMSVGPGVLVAAVMGVFVLLTGRVRALLVAAAPGAAMVLLCVMLGAGKPDEFARFLVLPAMLLCVAAAAALNEFWRRRFWAGLAGSAIAVGLSGAPAYVHAFWVDAFSDAEPRRAAGRWLDRRVARDESIGVIQEPAPYAVPPLDFATGTVVLLPKEPPDGASPLSLPEWLVWTDDGGAPAGRQWWRLYYEESTFRSANWGSAPITWASKPVYIFRRAE